jgi:hypothetical protein
MNGPNPNPDHELSVDKRAEAATGLKFSRPELTETERAHRNAILRELDD